MTYILVNLGYFFMFLALAAKDILLLRSILILGQLSLVSFGYFSDNLYVSFWNVLFFGINSFQIARLLRERRKIELPGELRDLYEQVFHSMSRREFLMFWNMGRVLDAMNFNTTSFTSLSDCIDQSESSILARNGHQTHFICSVNSLFNYHRITVQHNI